MAWAEFHQRQFPFGCDARMKNYAKEAFYAAYKAAHNTWIKISDIPEEWKDGRPLLLKGGHVEALSRGATRGHKDEHIGFSKALFDESDGSWEVSPSQNEYEYITGPTHAMLPM